MESSGARLVLYPHKDPEFRIWPIADIHYGNVSCAKDFLAADLDEIRRDPYSLWSLLGDYCDWIAPGDKRFDPECVDEALKVRDLARLGKLLTEKIVAMLEPIKARCIGAGYGNHETKYFRANAQACIHETLCKALGVPSLRYSGWVDLWFERRRDIPKPIVVMVTKPGSVGRPGQTRLRCFQHHGSGGAITTGGKLNMALRLAQMVLADLVMVGHVHEALAKPLVRLETDPTGTFLQQHVCGVMITGSYLKTYREDVTGYGEERGYAPATLGATRARYRPCAKELIIESKAQGVGLTVA